MRGERATVYPYGMTRDGLVILILTDSDGSQVAVRGKGKFLISQPFLVEGWAVELAQKLSADGTSAYVDWYDLNLPPVGLLLLSAGMKRHLKMGKAEG